jgi:hypothetical protein
VFDGQDGSMQRKETDADYKANRPDGGEALKPIRALPGVKAGLDLFAITWVEINDAEADDVIATLAARCPERDVLIASADKDFFWINVSASATSMRGRQSPNGTTISRRQAATSGLESGTAGMRDGCRSARPVCPH